VLTSATSNNNKLVLPYLEKKPPKYSLKNNEENKENNFK